MTITTFEIDGSTLRLVVNDLNPPATVQFTMADGSIVNRTTPDQTVGQDYTYEETITITDGIFSALVDDGLVTEVFGVIADITTGVSCLLHKTLCNELDCLLMQELYAIEVYVFDDKDVEPRDIYARVVKKCMTCATGAGPEVTNSQIFIINGVKVIQ
jgi:hypothetical protein